MTIVETHSTLSHRSLMHKSRHDLARLVLEYADQAARLSKLINTPETANFIEGVRLEAAHQRERWPAQHDAGKSPLDWFWLIGFLSQKAATAAIAGDAGKAMHHAISTAAALANWHLALAGVDRTMRPGIEPPEGGDQ